MEVTHVRLEAAGRLFGGGLLASGLSSGLCAGGDFVGRCKRSRVKRNHRIRPAIADETGLAVGPDHHTV